MSGKTTSIRRLFEKFNKIDQLTSIETSTGRTLFFDFGSLQFRDNDWSIKIGLYTATGQDFYAATRPATLTGVDGIIFVVDSQRNLLDDNLRSWNELHYYYGDNIYRIPMIINLNKQDLADVLSIQEISNIFKFNQFQNLDIQKTIALNGEGVIESFKKILQFLFPTITAR
jgi:signal recognition particle receptor subunit beta